MTNDVKAIHETMEESLIKLAIEKPWSWAWKFLVARDLLAIGRDVQAVKNMLRVTYPWLASRGLIKFNSQVGYYEAA